LGATGHRCSAKGDGTPDPHRRWAPPRRGPGTTRRRCAPRKIGAELDAPLSRHPDHPCARLALGTQIPRGDLGGPGKRGRLAAFRPNLDHFDPGFAPAPVVAGPRSPMRLSRTVATTRHLPHIMRAMRIEEFDYELPPELIAQEPPAERG